MHERDKWPKIVRIVVISHDWLARLSAFFLVMVGITLNGNALLALALTSPALPVPFSLVSFLAGVSFSGFFLFFPTGRLVPRWTGLILLLNIISAFLGNFPSPSPLSMRIGQGGSPCRWISCS